MVKNKDKVRELLAHHQSSATRIINELDGLGTDFMITEVDRSDFVQIAYAAQGRLLQANVNTLRTIAGLTPTADNNIVTKCDGIIHKSRHQERCAMDIVPLDSKGRLWWNAPTDVWKALGEVIKRNGWEWGGDWKESPAAVLGWDCPHCEVKK